MKSLSPQDDTYRYYLWAHGHRDAEIAQRVGVRKSTICVWRRHRGLEANDPRCNQGRRPNTKLRAEVLSWNSRGYTDRWIAQRTGFSKSNIHYTRRRLGLDAIRSRRWTSRELAVAAALWARGYTYPEVGKRIGRSGESVKTKLNRVTRWEWAERVRPWIIDIYEELPESKELEVELEPAGR